ncbi:MAG: hypothetical protein Q9169_008293, partial [Polycauliona sp. 2 TL-2023]
FCTASTRELQHRHRAHPSDTQSIMCFPDLIEIKSTSRKNRMHRIAGQPSRSRSPSPPCIITIEPRSPKVKQTESSPRISGLSIRGEVPLRRSRDSHRSRQSQTMHHPSPRSGHPSPRPPSQKPPTSESQKASRGSSSSSSSSSTSSKSSLRDLQEKIDNLIKRLATVEKDLQAEKERATQTISISIARDAKIVKEISGLKESVGRIDTRDDNLQKELEGLKEVVGCVNKEMDVIRKDAVWVKEQRGRSWDHAHGQTQRYSDGGGGGGREGRVRVEWERVRRSPREREESRSPRVRQGSR